MRSSGLAGGRSWGREEFVHRAEPADLPEWMDEPCSSEVLAACLRDLETVNRLTLSYRPTLRFLERVVERHGERALHVLDVGAGYGDMLRVIYRWAERRGTQVRLTGIDLNAQTADIARAATAAAGVPGDAIVWSTGDAFALTAAEGPDVVISSLVTHHLGHEELVAFLRWMEGSARCGWFVNDLERQAVPAWGFGLLARVMRWHPFVRHDGPVSFRRAFRVADWQSLLREAEIASECVRILPTFPARLCVERLR